MVRTAHAYDAFDYNKMNLSYLRVPFFCNVTLDTSGALHLPEPALDRYIKQCMDCPELHGSLRRFHWIPYGSAHRR